MAKDPWVGKSLQPQTLNKYTYVLSNPINYTDPTGMICVAGYGNCDEESDLVSLPWQLFPDNDNQLCWPEEIGWGCWGGTSYADFLDRYHSSPSSSIIPPPVDECSYNILDLIGSGFGRGYAEGLSFQSTQGAGVFFGSETVYSFATFERKAFEFRGYSLGMQNPLGAGFTVYITDLYGFDRNLDIVQDYQGWVMMYTVGGGPDLGLFGADGGVSGSNALSPKITPMGMSMYFSANYGSPIPIPFDVTGAIAEYRPLGNPRHPDRCYTEPDIYSCDPNLPTYGQGKVDTTALVTDILNTFPQTLLRYRLGAVTTAMRYAYFHNLIH